jgi:thioredoxin reductase
MDRIDVLIIGSGPAGLHAAIELKSKFGLAPLILEREADPGGVPRWCHHHTFPCRIKKRLFSGPGYVKAWLNEAKDIPIWTSTTVLRVDSAKPAVDYTSPRGPGRIEGRAVMLATGARESHRHQQLIPGDRAAGVFTTASLFQSLYLYGKLPGKHFAVYGSEDVSYSCIQTILKHGGTVEAVIEPTPSTRSWPAVRWYFENVRTVPHYFSVREMQIHGKSRVEQVSIESKRIACDAVVFTGGFTPNADLIRDSSWRFNPATRGPAINQHFQLSVPWAFAAGNCLRGVVSGDEAALEGREAAASIAAYLSGQLREQVETPLIVEPPLAYCSPDRIATGGGGVSRVAVWPAKHLDEVTLTARQSGTLLSKRTLDRVQPGRRIFVPLGELSMKTADPVLFTLLPSH